MGIRLDAAALFVGYRPPRDDEEGITPRQQRERRESLYRATMMRYDSTMDTEAARYLAKKPVADVAAMDVPQDRVLRLCDAGLEWL